MAYRLEKQGLERLSGFAQVTKLVENWTQVFQLQHNCSFNYTFFCLKATYTAFKKTSSFKLRVCSSGKLEKGEKKGINSLDVIQKFSKLWVSSKPAFEKLINMEHI